MSHFRKLNARWCNAMLLSLLSTHIYQWAGAGYQRDLKEDEEHLINTRASVANVVSTLEVSEPICRTDRAMITRGTCTRCCLNRDLVRLIQCAYYERNVEYQSEPLLLRLVCRIRHVERLKTCACFRPLLSPVLRMCQRMSLFCSSHGAWQILFITDS
ncbi:hypothetical protein BJ165DRAFT_708257 [Panaeolus papilionaceus]|nr:hypothetical protein BJ165DRAFT_708257 [Panaeolus papilionaceus]